MFKYLQHEGGMEHGEMMVINHVSSMTQDSFQARERRQALIHHRAAEAMRKAFSFPHELDGDLELLGESDPVTVEPLAESAFVNDDVATYSLTPPTIARMRETLQGRTAWAIDGGLLTWDFRQGVLVVGKVTVVQIKYYNTPSVDQVLEFPMLPLVLEKVPMKPSDDFPELLNEFFHHAMAIFPATIPTRGSSHVTRYYSSSDEFFNTVPDELLSLSFHERESWKKRVDAMREIAEHVATVFCLRNAKNGDVVLRDGQIFGSYRFTRQLQYRDEHDMTLLDYLREDIQQATERGVRLVGVVKRPAASYCLKWFHHQNHEETRWHGSDSALYDAKLAEGQRSNLWKMNLSIKKSRDPRGLVKWFHENTGFFYIKTRNHATPLRIEFCLHAHMYEQWIHELADQVYYMSLGSGHVAGLPHGIVIADNYAKVRRTDVHLMIKGIIETLESSEASSDRDLAIFLRKKFFSP